MTRQSILFVLGIALIAASFRLLDPGLLPTWVDELKILEPALRLAYGGDWIWYGSTTSIDALPIHSPFTTYITAFFALISPHPLAIRFMYGLTGVICVCMIYGFMRRTTGEISAIVAALFLAVMPLAIYWSRFIWNPNLAPVFIIIWLFTAREYFEQSSKHSGKQQVIHWLSLSALIQSQAALVVLAPVTIVLSIYAALTRRYVLRPYLKRHLIALALCLITMLPWFYGLYGVSNGFINPTLGFGRASAGELGIGLPSLSRIWHFLALLTANANYQRAILEISTNWKFWWAPNYLHYFLWAQTVVTVIGTLVIFQEALVKRKLTWEVFLSVMVYYPLGFLLIEGSVKDYYLMPVMYTGLIIFGLMIQKLLARSSYWIVLVGLLFVSQVWLSVSIFDHLHHNPQTLTLNETIDLVETWTANGTNDALVLENSTVLSRREQLEWIFIWRILSYSYPLRYLEEGTSIPVTSRQVIITEESQELELAWLGAGELYSNHKRNFVASTVRVENLPEIAIAPIGEQFSTLVNLKGISANSPQSTQDWQLDVIWEPLQSQTQQYQFSVRLAGTDGIRYGQIDGSTLAPRLWRAGDTVITTVQMPVAENFTATDGWYIELILYRLQDGGVITVINEAGLSTGETLHLHPVIAE